MRPFQFIVLTPPGLADPSLAIAASRAGGLGILDLEYAHDEGATLAAMARLARYTRSACGIMLDSRDQEFVARVTSDLPEQIQVVILTSADSDTLPQQVQLLHRRNLTVLMETTGLEQGQLGEQVDVDGLIAKGEEAGGWIGQETTFILLQRLLAHTSLPVWARGGIGLHTAAACYAAGAAGVVLDSQLALTRESPLPETTKAIIAGMDGSETAYLGTELGDACRVYTRPGLPALEELRRVARALAQDDRPRAELLSTWRQAVQGRVGWNTPEENLWLLGQDAAFAAPLARQFHTVGGVLNGLRQAIDSHARLAATLRPLDEGSPLARSHGTRYPIVQGPMTRVSDTAAFAARVAEGGGLPFLALALLRAPEVRALLEETQRQLGDRPWGVGILGFVPLELRQEQLEVVRAYRPPYALIAGGRPDQARSLERDGIPTYLHVPSPGLLRMFLQDGARRFVFEGRECGGHVGPRSSFVLWNTMIDVLLEALPAQEASDCHVLFAGGIHDALSASMVATMAAPLAERGVHVGVLLGTSYLFTQEAVESGAIQPGFQEEALHCEQTALVESGPGHAIRCVPTPYVDLFQQEKQRLLQEGKSPDEIRQWLEDLNIGRLRIASKGVTRHPRYGQDPDVPKFITLSDEEQHAQGMYMIGQLAALRDQICTIEELHHEIAVEGSQRVEDLVATRQSVSAPLPAARPSEIAIVGISCILPKAQDLQAYWENILNKVYAITEVPKERWDWEQYYDPDVRARDKIYSKWGGFIDEVPFDPVEYGMPPNSLLSIDPMQLLALKTVRVALQDAGLLERPFDRSRTSVILGASGGVGELGTAYVLRSGLPLLFGRAASDIISNSNDILPEWTEDSFAGLLLNVAAGRIANRFDFGGLNYIVDAACASSLTAVHLAVKELETYNTDMVIAGGVDTVQSPFGYLCFSKTQALSPTGEPRTFDATADGIAISEGIVMLVLKRLADAERDGDRIYAVIQGVGGSSDGKAKGLTAPRPEGQMLALQRAYAKVGISPTTVGLFEAHGTGTVVGDRAEALSLSTFLEEAGAAPQSHAVGSVKSMIGHTKATAGVAALAKVALSLYHKVLPPTLGVTQPNPKARFGEGPLYINSETRPWIHGVHDYPRRAGVSAFGFGGTNFHAVVEEYTGDFLPRPAVAQRWPSELLLLSAESRQELLSAVESLTQALDQGAKPELRDLAYTLWQVDSARQVRGASPHLRLAIVASTLEDLQQKLAQTRTALSAAGPAHIQDPRGIYYTEEPLARESKVAFLFPGQGSQYPNMLRDLAVQFSEVREAFERADRVLVQQFSKPLSSYIFPPPAFNPDEEHAQQQALTQTNVAQPALGAADIALCYLLKELGVTPEMVAGHSYGEYVALCAAGVFDEETLFRLSEARGRSIVEAAGQDLGTMAAVSEGPERIAEVLEGVEGVWIANLNAPRQTIISGTRPGVDQAVERLKSQGIRARSISVACAFHSPIIAPARDRLAKALSAAEFFTPRLEVFSNATAAPYPHDPQDITGLLGEHLVRPVRFADEVEAMYRAGARIFAEIGPRTVLSGLTQQILGERPHVVLSVDAPNRPGLTQLQHALGQLAANGISVQLDRLFQGRVVRRLNLNTLVEDTRDKPLSPTTWLVNGARARPLNQPVRLQRAPLASLALPSPNGDGKVAESTEAPTPTSAPPSSAHVDGPSGDRPVRDGLQLSAPTSQAAPAFQGPVVVAPPDDEAGQVMLQFQHLMGRFLETQKNVMLTYLQGAPAEATTDHQPPITADQPVTADGRLLEEKTPRAGMEAPPVRRDDPSVVASALIPTVSQEEREAVVSREEVTRQLLQIVSERTGYPPEMLDLDVDIEADLGIDSIKRVEILGALQQACIPPERQIGQEAMEQLTSIKTLQGVVDWVDSALRGDTEEEADEVAAQQPEVVVAEETPRDPSTEIPRARLAVVDAPAVSDQSTLFVPNRVVLITDDERGIAQAVAQQVRDHGGRAVLVRLAGEVGEIEPGVYRADLTDPAKVAELVAMLRQQHGPIGGIVHLLPLGDGTDFQAMGLAAWRERIRREVKSLYYLARATAGDLKQAGEGEGAWLVAVTAMGGAFGMDASEQQSSFPAQGGIAGLIKTLALEWPSVRCKVVDLEMENPIPTLAQQLLQEIAASDGLVEVGYQGLRRQILQPALAPLDQSGSAHLAIDSDWVILATGGARGITSEVVCELAERYRPTLLLVGSSPLPEAEESSHTAGLTSPQELKTALMAQVRQAGEQVTLARVEAAYGRLMKDREIRHNLGRMQRAGATVRYYQADVRDERAMADLMGKILGEYGRLDGVVHGAGIIEDKLIEDKTPDSFDRVFDTKADSAFILSRVLPADSLKFLVLFSSAAGPFGNRGQCDYAAANEVLNKLAIHLDRNWPGRVVSINWGPWAKTGMVSPEVQQQFAKRGVELISVPTGRRIFDRELRYGRKGEAEIIMAGGGWGAPADTSNVERSNLQRSTLNRDALPLLQGAAFPNGRSDTVEVVRTLDPTHDLYLRDHQLDEKPVLPAAVALELMAEVAQHGWPDLEVIGLRDVRVFRGVVLKDGPKTIRMVARSPGEPLNESLGLNVNIEISDVEGTGLPYYRGTVELADRLPEPPLYQMPVIDGLQPFPMEVGEAYSRWLFHGPLLQGITAIQGISRQGVVATCSSIPVQQLLAGDPQGEWLIDPVVCDSGLQLILLWARAYHDITALPAHLVRYRRYESLTGSAIRCYVQASATSDGHVIHADLSFVDPDGRLLGVLEGLECIGSKALNRLAAEHQHKGDVGIL